MSIWLNGQLAENGVIDARSAGLNLGWGVFTTVGVKAGQPIFARRHIERLHRDATAAQLQLDFAPEVLLSAIQEVLRANRINDGLLRLTLTQNGDGRWSQETGTTLTIQAIPAIRKESDLKVRISRFRSEAERALSGVKTTSYLPTLWASREAQEHGYDDVILLDCSKNLSESSRANLFWFERGELYTPALSTGCLQGLGREIVLQWAEERELTVHQGCYAITNFCSSDEAFLVSAAAGPRVVSSLFDEENEVLKTWNGEPRLHAQLKGWWDAKWRAEL